MAKLRSLADEEKIALNRKRKEINAKSLALAEANVSKSQMKKQNAANHNEWQKYIRENKIIFIFSYVYTEREEVIDGTLEVANEIKNGTFDKKELLK